MEENFSRLRVKRPYTLQILSGWNQFLCLSFIFDSRVAAAVKSIIQEYKYCFCFWEEVPHWICLDSGRRQSGEKETDLWFRGFCSIFHREI